MKIKSLKSLIILTIALIFFIFSVIYALIEYFFVYQSFKKIEQEQIIKNINTCEHILKREEYHLYTFCSDWSIWDDTYNFVISRSPRYIKSNLQLNTFTDNDIHLIFYLNQNRKVIWAKIYDYHFNKLIHLKDFPEDSFPENCPLISFQLNPNNPAKSGLYGIFLTEWGPMIVASAPILKTSGEGPLRGFLIMGKFLDPDLIKDLSKKININFGLLKASDIQKEKLWKRLKAQKIFIKKEGNYYIAYKILPTLNHKFLIIKTIISRKILAEGQKQLLYNICFILLIEFILLTIIWILIDKTTLKPITKLLNDIGDIKKTGDLSKRTQDSGKYEIALLIKEFNEMLDTLEQKKRKLEEINKELMQEISRRQETEKALKESEERIHRMKRMEAIGLLAGGVAHDLNNILSGVVGYPEIILMDKGIPKNYRECLEKIKKSGQRAAEIVNDLLTITRGIAINKKATNINHIIKEYITSPEYDHLKKQYPNITLETKLDNELFNIYGSPHHLRKMIMNLIVNAFEAIKDQGTVSITTKNITLKKSITGYDTIPEGTYATVSIADTGPGISQKDLDKIFEPFYSRKTLGRSGTGLGLTIVWNVVREHQGYIDIESDSNGTTFKLYFPAIKQKLPEKEKESPIEDWKGNGETILIVDDEEIQRDLISEMLKSLHYNPIAVETGKEALEYLKKQDVKVILLDMLLGNDTNGWEIYDQICRVKPKQKVILMSGFSKTEDVRQAQKAGAGTFLKKPFDLKVLAQALKQELEKDF